MHPRMFLPAAVVGAMIGYMEEVAQEGKANEYMNIARYGQI